MKNIVKLLLSQDHCHHTGEYRGAAHNTCNLKYSVPKKSPIACHSESNHGYHFIMKELAEEFKKQCTCLGENTKKYITFILSIEKEVTRIDKNGEEISKNISYILQFIGIARFVASSLSTLVNNLSEGIRKIKCKYGHSVGIGGMVLIFGLQILHLGFSFQRL